MILALNEFSIEKSECHLLCSRVYSHLNLLTKVLFRQRT